MGVRTLLTEHAATMALSMPHERVGQRSSPTAPSSKPPADLGHAKSLYLDAMHLAQETGQQDDEAVALEGLAEHHLSTGETEPALAYLTQALEIFQHLGMTPDAERVGARLNDPSTG